MRCDCRRSLRNGGDKPTMQTRDDPFCTAKRAPCAVPCRVRRRVRWTSQVCSSGSRKKAKASLSRRQSESSARSSLSWRCCGQAQHNSAAAEQHRQVSWSARSSAGLFCGSPAVQPTVRLGVGVVGLLPLQNAGEPAASQIVDQLSPAPTRGFFCAARCATDCDMVSVGLPSRDWGEPSQGT